MPQEAAGEVVDIYTDGACSGNPGPGGWGAVLRYRGHEKELCGGEPGRTTNNRMELMAAIQALESLTRPVPVHLHTDSTYLRNGITKWLPGWKRNGWKTADKRPVKNADLWQRLEVAVSRHDVDWRWVRGHAGNAGNERADALANRGMAAAMRAPSQGGAQGGARGGAREGARGGARGGRRKPSAAADAPIGPESRERPPPERDTISS